MNIVYKTRLLLVRFAKVFPFVLCAIIGLSYIESMYAILTESFCQYGEYVVLYKPFSWFVGNIFVYNWYTIIAAATLSVSMQTCFYNKISVLYAVFNILEKDYFLTIELYPHQIIIIVLANILICGFFCYKGIRILTSSRKQ